MHPYATTFKGLLVWQKAYELTLLIYEYTRLFPKEEMFGLTSQIRRAAVSITSNIAEGFKKHSKKDRIHSYKIAECSLEEVKNQSMLSKDLAYLTLEQYKKIEFLESQTGQLLSGWIQKQQ